MRLRRNFVRGARFHQQAKFALMKEGDLGLATDFEIWKDKEVSQALFSPQFAPYSEKYGFQLRENRISKYAKIEVNVTVAWGRVLIKYVF